MTVKNQLAQALASAKSLEASMMTFEQQTQNTKAKAMYQNLSQIMSDVSQQLETRMTEIQNEEPQYKPNQSSE